MQTKFFCDLYVSEGWEKKKLKLIKKIARKINCSLLSM